MAGTFSESDHVILEFLTLGEMKANGSQKHALNFKKPDFNGFK